MTFKKGEGGRAKGSRNKLSAAFLSDLCEEWREGGREAMRIMRLERPAEFVKTVAYLMPKELDITTSNLNEVSDEQLDQFIEFARQQLAKNVDAAILLPPTPKKEPAE